MLLKGMPMAELTATTEQQPNHTTIRVSGYLSGEHAESLETAFADLGNAKQVLLDFDEKCFINSAGLAVLFDLLLPMRDQGTKFRIVHPAPHFRKVFDIVGLSKDVGVYEAEGAAVSGW